MRLIRHYLFASLSFLWLASSVYAQDSFDGLKQGFFWRYNYGGNRLVQLAEALPEETFSFKPNEGAMTMERVFMHIIHYNYFYPESALGIMSPEEIDIEKLEEMTGKEAVLTYLQGSIDHVRKVVEEISDEELRKTVKFYGTDTQAINVFMQLQGHMAEHLGQLLAYTRMNDIVPPWSQ